MIDDIPLSAFIYVIIGTADLIMIPKLASYLLHYSRFHR